MKKMIVLLAVLFGTGVIAESVDMNGKFKDTSGTPPMPSKWLQNKGEWVKPFGEGKIVKIENGNVFQVTSLSKPTPFYTDFTTKAQANDVFAMRIEARGKGKVSIGVYIYDEKGGWIGVAEKSFNVTDNFVFYDAEITVSDGKPNVEGDRKTANNVRFYFQVSPEADIFIRNISAVKK